MFGALNRFISRLDGEPPPQESGTGGAGGFQVLRNTNNDLPIEPWFDFIVGINGRNIENPDPNLFATEVRNCAGTSVNLGLWSAKGQKTRSIYASVPADSPSIGLSLQWTPLAAAEDVWHILDVAPNSPADDAGLLPYGDYIVSSPEGILKGESGLGELVEDYLNRPLRLHVYNHEHNVTRLVTIHPSRAWGGAGALGCVLGYGALHRLPAPLDEPPQGPGETLFDEATPGDETTPSLSPPPAPQGGGGGGDLLVPADMPVQQRGAGTTKRGARGGARHAAPAAGGGDMDAYFAEGEAKSRELEGGGSTSKPKEGGGAPPPPKSGAPPKDAISGGGGGGAEEDGNAGTVDGGEDDKGQDKPDADEGVD